MFSKKRLAKSKELRDSIFITVLLLVVFRFLSYVPVPWVDPEKLSFIAGNPVLEMAGLFSGGALTSFTFMATGISSYVTASIVIQLLIYSIPKLYELSKNPDGEKVIRDITLVLSIIISFMTSIGLTVMFNNTFGFLESNETKIYVFIALVHILGTIISVNIGEYITENGVGNGISLLIFTNVVSSVPQKTMDLLNNPLFFGAQKALFILTLVLMMVIIVMLEMSEKRIEVKYAKNVLSDLGIKKDTYIPLKLNLNGVMPIIFATTVIQTLGMLAEFIENDTFGKIVGEISPGMDLYPVATTVLIFIFSFFYSSLVFNPKDIADGLQSQGGVIGNIRPGKATALYLKREGREIALLNSIFLAVLSLLPVVVLTKIGFPIVGATSLMIVISVAIEIYTDVKTEIDLINNSVVIEDLIDIE